MINKLYIAVKMQKKAWLGYLSMKKELGSVDLKKQIRSAPKSAPRDRGGRVTGNKHFFV